MRHCGPRAEHQSPAALCVGGPLHPGWATPNFRLLPPFCWPGVPVHACTVAVKQTGFPPCARDVCAQQTPDHDTPTSDGDSPFQLGIFFQTIILFLFAIGLFSFPISLNCVLRISSGYSLLHSSPVAPSLVSGSELSPDAVGVGFRVRSPTAGHPERDPTGLGVFLEGNVGLFSPTSGTVIGRAALSMATGYLQEFLQEIPTPRPDCAAPHSVVLVLSQLF